VRNNRIDALSPYFHSDFHGVMVTGRAVNSFAEVQQYWRDIRASSVKAAPTPRPSIPSGA